MKKNYILVFATVLCAASAAQARGWRMTIGPGFRSSMKTELRGTPSAADTTERVNTQQYTDLENGDWEQYESIIETKADPKVEAVEGSGNGNRFAIPAKYDVTTVHYDGTGTPIDATDHPSSLGVKARMGFDFYENETISVGLDLRFAGYWNMKSSASGRIAGSRATTTTYTDYWLFEDGSYPRDGAYARNPYANDPVHRQYDEFADNDPTVVEGDTTLGRAVGMRIRSDLYQIGLGPTVSWHALSWLDAYVSVAALCNIASLDFEAGDSRTSETKCALGFAGDLGLAAYLTDNIGLYAEVGYEWIDRFDVEVDALSARMDYSSLVLSAGLAFRF